jgi:hypothetical protein
VFIFPNVSTVYIVDLDTRESLTLIEAINVEEDTTPAILILLGSVLLKKFFNNNIFNNVLFTTNKETGSRFAINILAINYLEHFKRATYSRIKTR